MNQEKQYDFIIVGSGIGGLSSAVVLAKNGFSVLVLEKNNQSHFKKKTNLTPLPNESEIR